MRTKRIFISDIHIGTNEIWSWFKNQEHQRRLLSFLKWIKEQEDVKDLVLLGDIFDTWVHPYNMEPIDIKDIFNNTDLLNELSDYGAYNIQEMIAEGWAEFRGSANPRDIAKKIGGIIENAYKERYN